MKKETKIKFKATETGTEVYTVYQIEVNTGNEVIPFKSTRNIYQYLKHIYPYIDVEEVQGTIFSEDKCFVSNREKIEYIEYKITTDKLPTSIRIAPEKSIGKDLARALIHSKATLKDK